MNKSNYNSENNHNYKMEGLPYVRDERYEVGVDRLLF